MCSNQPVNGCHHHHFEQRLALQARREALFTAWQEERAAARAARGERGGWAQGVPQHGAYGGGPQGINQLGYAAEAGRGLMPGMHGLRGDFGGGRGGAGRGGRGGRGGGSPRVRRAREFLRQLEEVATRAAYSDSLRTTPGPPPLNTATYPGNPRTPASSVARTPSGRSDSTIVDESTESYESDCDYDYDPATFESDSMGDPPTMPVAEPHYDAGHGFQHHLYSPYGDTSNHMSMSTPSEPRSLSRAPSTSTREEPQEDPPSYDSIWEDITR